MAAVTTVATIRLIIIGLVLMTAFGDSDWFLFVSSLHWNAQISLNPPLDKNLASGPHCIFLHWCISFLFCNRKNTSPFPIFQNTTSEHNLDKHPSLIQVAS